MRVLHEKREKDDVVQNLSGLLPEVEGSVGVTVIIVSCEQVFESSTVSGRWKNWNE
jgi:hypothetical protein